METCITLRDSHGRFDGNLVERVHASLADCPRTADEVAAAIGEPRLAVAKALTKLKGKGQVVTSEDSIEQDSRGRTIRKVVYEVAVR